MGPRQEHSQLAAARIRFRVCELGVVEYDDTRRDYGERRVVALGLADGVPLTVVFTDRVDPDGGIVRRLISARVSHRKERRRYAESLKAIQPPDEGAG